MEKIATELLAPAGSIESMKAAFCAGADAVYIGGPMFGARAYADNPDNSNLLDAIDYAHIRGKRLYMTVNTLLKNDEIDNYLYDYIKPFYERGLDAVIVQDLGVLRFIRENFPDIHIHASTQMTVTGVYSAKLLEGYGVSRVVTARELSLGELERIRKETDLEIESFVHGAMCYSYSGQCLFSSLAGGRSGNRGRCAQPCRKPYLLSDDEGNLLNRDKSKQFILSLKDMNTIRLIPDIVASGVDSLKIEGRMKKPEYTAGVVSIYRKYLDKYLSGEDSTVTDEDYRRLFDLFNRNGFSEGYYKRHNGKNMITMSEPKFRVKDDEWQESIRKNYIERELKRKIKGNVTICQYVPVKITMEDGDESFQLTGMEALAAQNKPLNEEAVIKQFKKSGGTDFEITDLSVKLSDNSFLTVGQMNEMRRNALEGMRDVILSRYRRTAPKRVSEVFSETCEKGAVYTAQVHTRGQLIKVLENDRIRRVYIDLCVLPLEELKKEALYVHSLKKECFLVLPQIMRDDLERFLDDKIDMIREAGLDGFLCPSIEALAYMREKGFKTLMADHTLYAMNRYADNQLKTFGASMCTCSVELNENELKDIASSQELIVYGYLPMMVTANCVCNTCAGCRKSEGRKEHIYYIIDEAKRRFPVLCSCFNCMNTILNCEPLYLLDYSRKLKNISPRSMRLVFTIESPAETERILSRIGKEEAIEHMTRGHLKRGVE